MPLNLVFHRLFSLWRDRSDDVAICGSLVEAACLENMTIGPEKPEFKFLTTSPCCNPAPMAHSPLLSFIPSQGTKPS